MVPDLTWCMTVLCVPSLTEGTNNRMEITRPLWHSAAPARQPAWGMAGLCRHTLLLQLGMRLVSCAGASQVTRVCARQMSPALRNAWPAPMPACARSGWQAQRCSVASRSRSSHPDSPRCPLPLIRLYFSQSHLPPVNIRFMLAQSLLACSFWIIHWVSEHHKRHITVHGLRPGQHVSFCSLLGQFGCLLHNALGSDALLKVTLHSRPSHVTYACSWRGSLPRRATLWRGSWPASRRSIQPLLQAARSSGSC